MSELTMRHGAAQFSVAPGDLERHALVGLTAVLSPV